MIFSRSNSKRVSGQNWFDVNQLLRISKLMIYCGQIIRILLKRNPPPLCYRTPTNITEGKILNYIFVRECFKTICFISCVSNNYYDSDVLLIRFRCVINVSPTRIFVCVRGINSEVSYISVSCVCPIVFVYVFYSWHRHTKYGLLNQKSVTTINNILLIC